MKPAIFLDRDGTLIVEVGYLDRLERLRVFPWSIDAVRALNRAGFLAVLVTNQAGVAHGFYDEDFVAATHEHLVEVFAAGGAAIDGCYYCPHHPEAAVERYRTACDCRKPGAGLIRRAQAELGIDLAGSFVVGDRWRDIQAAHAAGVRGVLVRTGHGSSEERRPPAGLRPAFVADTLIDAAAWILEHRHARA
jgi:D-glycero-D-manno-heptose 1,7-bisphosphate phosphatase